MECCAFLPPTQARLIEFTPKDSQGALSRLQLSLHTGVRGLPLFLTSNMLYGICKLQSHSGPAPCVVSAQRFALVMIKL